MVLSDPPVWWVVIPFVLSEMKQVKSLILRCGSSVISSTINRRHVTGGGGGGEDDGWVR